MKPLDLVGHRSGHLLVVSKSMTRNRHAFWNCRCDCGKPVEVRGDVLQAQRTQSCGCHDGLTYLQKFWASTKPAENDKGCIFWTGYVRPDGYGTFAFESDNIRAHRWIFEQLRGPIGDFVLLHSCDEPTCVNPDHLSIGTHADNIADARSKGRQAWQKQTHCKRGHELTPENTVDFKRCRTCREERAERLNERKRNGRPAMPQRTNRGRRAA